MKKSTRKGFTITELVIVIAVIAILAAVLIPTFTGVIEKANKSAVLQEARTAYTEAYADDIEDGIIDGNDVDGNAVAATKGTYAVDAGTATFELVDSDRGYTASFDGADWSVAANS